MNIQNNFTTSINKDNNKLEFELKKIDNAVYEELWNIKKIKDLTNKYEYIEKLYGKDKLEELLKEVETYLYGMELPYKPNVDKSGLDVSYQKFKNKNDPIWFYHQMDIFINRYTYFTKEKRILLISPSFWITEALYFIYLELYKNYDFNNSFEQIIIRSYRKKDMDKYLPKYNDIKNFHKSMNNDIDNKFLSNNYFNKKFDFIICDSYPHKYYKDDKKISFTSNYIEMNINSIIFIKEIIVALKNLNNGGDMMITIRNIYSKLNYDILCMLNTIFNKIDILHQSFLALTFNLTIQIFCSKYTKNNEIIEKLEYVLKNIDKKEYEQKIINLSNYNYNMYNNYSLLSNNNKELIDKLKNFNLKLLNKVNNNFDDLIYIQNNLKNLKFIKNEIINSFIKVCKQVNIKVNPMYLSDKYKADFNLTLLGDLYSTDYTVNFKFPNFSKYNIELYDSAKINKKKLFLDNLIIKFNNYSRLFETRNLDNYKRIKTLTRYYEKTLENIITKKINGDINGRNISRGFSKMYEILDTFDIVPNKEKINTLHACEAPGNFIVAFNHYIKTKTKVKEYNWIAQSYKPGKQIGNLEKAFGDNYGIIKKYTDKWDFGFDGTGDITKLKNIEYYREKYKNLDIITLDCGIGWALLYSKKEEKNFVIKLLFCEIIFVLRVLSKNGNGVVKMKFDQLDNPAMLSLICLVLSLFENVYIYKPFVNPWTPEIYIIMKNYINILEDKDYKIISKFIEEFDMDKEILDLDKITEKIKANIYEVFKKLINRNIFYIKRNIYYLDNFKNISLEEFKIIKEEINRRNIDWIEKFNIKEIENKDKL